MTQPNFPPLPGVPPNFSLLAAMSAGLVPANVQVTPFAAPNQTLMSVLSSAGANGSQFNAVNNTAIVAGPTGPAGSAVNDGGAVEIQASMPESGLTFATPPGYGGN